MKSNIKIVIVLISLLFGVRAISQDYFNRVIPFEFGAPNPAQLELVNENFIIPVIYFGSQSTLVEVSPTGEINYHHVNDFIFSFNPLNYTNGLLYSFAKDREQEKALKIGEFDENYDLVFQSEIETKGDYNFPSSSTVFQNALYFSFMYIDKGDKKMGLSKISLDGETEWVNYYFEDEDYSYPWNILPTSDGNLLLSYTLQYEEDKNNQQPFLMKVDTLGNVIWNSKPFDNFDSGIIKIAELSNGQYLMAYHADVWHEYDVLCCYDPWTPTLIWTDENGEILKENLYLIPHYDEIYITGIETGKGDYFFSYGMYTEDPSDPVELPDKYYGFITKHTNEGDTIWTKKYQHPEFTNHGITHYINDIVELDNGDIAAMGSITPLGERPEIWLFKVDNNGCFDSDNCDDDVQIITSIESTIEVEKQITLYPNPTTGDVSIDGMQDYEIDRIIVYDMIGKEVFFNTSKVRMISLSHLPSGSYIIHVLMKNGNIKKGKIVLTHN